MKGRRQNAEGRSQSDAHARRGRLGSSFLLHPSALIPHPSLRRGFSFTEVMFAVVILGIGFIMVAAIFPVALQQAKDTSEETNGAAIARTAEGYLGQVMTDGPVPKAVNVAAQFDSTSTSNCPPVLIAGGTISTVSQPWNLMGTGNINVAITGPPPSTYTAPFLWDIVRGNLIRPDDPGYGWIFLYRRDVSPQNPNILTSVAQVLVFPVHVRSTSAFDPAVDTKSVSGGLPRLAAKDVNVSVQDSTIVPGAGVDLVYISKSTGPTASGFDNSLAATEGAYVVIADDQLPSTARGRSTGQIFRLGVRRLDYESAGILVFELPPGSDFTPYIDPGPNGKLETPPGSGDDITVNGIGVDGSGNPTNPVPGFLVGQDYADPANPSAGFAGGAMPLGAYTTFVKIQQ